MSLAEQLIKEGVPDEALPEIQNLKPSRAVIKAQETLAKKAAPEIPRAPVTVEEKPKPAELSSPIESPQGASTGSESSASEFVDDLDDKIHFNDLPTAWQKHILERKEKGFIPVDQDEFRKGEIIEASSYEGGTDPLIVDKVFERAKKEKVPFDLLSPEWQETLNQKSPGSLRAIELFGDVTVDVLQKVGMSEYEIKALQKTASERARIAGLTVDLSTPKEVPIPIPTLTTKKILEESSSPKKSLWSRFKSRLGF